MPKVMRVAVVCGGPSRERGISLNSARTVLDHLGACEDIEILPFYVDMHKNFHEVTPGQLCCNTPSDFDFKLPDKNRMSAENFLAKIQDVDVVFPVIHGAFGEDGELQAILERAHAVYVGAPPEVSARMFSKAKMRDFLRQNGYSNGCAFVTCSAHDPACEEKIDQFSQQYLTSCAVVKPNYGGSSIGVFVVKSPQEALEKVRALHEQGDTDVLLEEFMRGQEFTVIVLQDHESGCPVALLPTEISILSDGDEIFSYRRKYLPTTNTRWRCPSFDADIDAVIRAQAEKIFQELGCLDFARMDGWVCDGEVVWSDFNPISGLEQNSFLFLQSARVGMTHQHVLRYIVQNACLRAGKKLPLPVEHSPQITHRKVFVLCGGDTAERQVSLMSGLNVFLQLRNTGAYSMHLFLLCGDVVWRVPYAFGLFHTVEEVREQCEKGELILQIIERYVQDLRGRLHMSSDSQGTLFAPKQYTLQEFLDAAYKDDAFVFLGLHGGRGENGAIQAMLEEKGCSFNGSSSQACALFMDKNRTGNAVNSLEIQGVYSLPKYFSPLAVLKDSLWDEIVRAVGVSTVLVKPNADGCSAGVVVLRSQEELATYCALLRSQAPCVKADTFYGQREEIMLPTVVEDLLFEPFIQCDEFCVDGHVVRRVTHEGWVELTIGVIEREGALYALSPSITLAEGAVLSLEEKFQGGTGVNITPPPDFIINPDDVRTIRDKTQMLAQKLGVRGYARIDVFYNTKSRSLCVIEVNALPGLTASTVFYHQGIAEDPPVYPRDLLQKLL